MAWSISGFTAITEVASGSLTFPAPTGSPAEGDLLVACIAYKDNAAFTLPAGWSLAGQENTGNTTVGASGVASALMAYIVRGASVPDLTFVRTGGDVARGRIVAYAGGSGTPLDTTASTTLAVADSTITVGSITTASANELVVAMLAGGAQASLSDCNATDPGTASTTSTSAAPAVGAWQRRVTSVTSTGSDTSIGIADAVRGTAGATGNIIINTSGSGGTSHHAMVAAAFKIASVVGPMTGSAALALSTSAVLAGQGALSGSSSLGLTATATAAAAGALSGTSSLSLAPSASLAGAGTLTGTATVGFTPTGSVAALTTPVFQATGMGAAGAGAVTVDWPAHSTGDVALLIVESDKDDAISLSTAAGFVEIPASALVNTAIVGSASKLAVFWCRATSTAMTSPVLAAVTDHQGAVIVTYRGCVPTGNPWNAIVSEVNDTPATSVSAPAVTTTVADTCIVSVISRGVDTIVPQFSDWGNGAVERFDLGTNVGNGGGFGIADYGFAGPGTTTATTATLNNASATCAYTLALTAVAVGAVTGTASITLATAGTVAGAGALAGVSALSLAPAGMLAATAALSGTVTLAFDASATAVPPDSGIAGTTSLALSTSGTLAGSGALTGSASLSLAPAATLAGSAAVAGSADLAFTAQGDAFAGAVASGTASLALSAAADLAGSGALAGTSSLSFAATATTNGTVSVTGSASVNLTASAILHGTVAAQGSATLAFDPSATGNLTGYLDGTALIAIALTADLLGRAALTGTAALEFTSHVTGFTDSGRAPTVAARPDSWADGAVVQPRGTTFITSRQSAGVLVSARSGGTSTVAARDDGETAIAQRPDSADLIAERP